MAPLWLVLLLAMVRPAQQELRAHNQAVQRAVRGRAHSRQKQQLLLKAVMLIRVHSRLVETQQQRQMQRVRQVKLMKKMRTSLRTATKMRCVFGWAPQAMAGALHS
jgi:hypothetical protein